MDGTTPVKKRQKMIAQFNQENLLVTDLEKKNKNLYNKEQNIKNENKNDFEDIRDSENFSNSESEGQNISDNLSNPLFLFLLTTHVGGVGINLTGFILYILF
jgi:SNF2 family DNA or RNA helicase